MSDWTVSFSDYDRELIWEIVEKLSLLLNELKEINENVGRME